MIEVEREELIALADVPAILPRRRGGKKAHISCIYRWSTAGCKGVVLETVQIGGTRCTSKQALARFFERLSEHNGSHSRESPTARDRRRERERKRAEEECRAARI